MVGNIEFKISLNGPFQITRKRSDEFEVAVLRSGLDLTAAKDKLMSIIHLDLAQLGKGAIHEIDCDVRQAKPFIFDFVIRTLVAGAGEQEVIYSIEAES